MKRCLLFLILVCMSGIPVLAAKQTDSSFIESPITLTTASGDIFGTLCTPKTGKTMPVALIIAGSGPTDRDGNNSMMKNNSLKQLAYGLADAGIASVRFDKRGIAASEKAGKKEADLRFENYIDDATGWIHLLKKDARFSKVIVIGHSEGSLIGMIAAKNGADKYISIAGAGQSADALLKLQLAKQPQEVQDLCFPILDSLKAGKTVKDVNPMLYSLFRPEIQPYMISWFRHDPQEEIKKLGIPVLIIQGKNDLQVKEDDANRLLKAYPSAKLVLIENMNHVFKTVTGGEDENIKAYSDPLLPISPVLVNAVIDFIKGK